jgi:hypothetical protein
MSSSVLIILAVLAGAICPAHMWWSQRRGRQAACCPPRSDARSELEELRERQTQLRAQIDAAEAARSGPVAAQAEHATDA